MNNRKCIWCQIDISHKNKNANFCLNSHSISFNNKKKSLKKFNHFLSFLKNWIMENNLKYFSYKLIVRNAKIKQVNLIPNFSWFFYNLKKYSKFNYYFDKKELLLNYNDFISLKKPLRRKISSNTNKHYNFELRKPFQETFLMLCNPFNRKIDLKFLKYWNN